VHGQVPSEALSELGEDVTQLHRGGGLALF
jgi:hypothetical protein